MTFSARARLGRGVMLGAVALVCGMMVALVAGVAPAQAHPVTASGKAGRADTIVQQAVVRDSPAVVRIVSVVEARLRCGACATDGSDVVSPAPGSDPFTFYSSGSGAFISSSGDILTADHVVDHSMSNPEDVDFVEQQASQDIAQRYNTTANQALQYLRNSSDVSITFKVTYQRAFLSTAYTGNLTDTSHIYAFDVQSILASSPVSKQDTAIARINTSGITPAPDFPYLTLSTSPVQALDTVTAIAFPADADLALNSADFTALVTPSSSDANTVTSLLSPSVNSGQVTNANEVRSDGTPVYEANGISSQGSSGGPVVNDQGQVIGFVDAGPSTDRLTFIIPSTVVATYASQAGISTSSSGRFMALWAKALGEYYGTGACHWTNAAADFSTLRKQYPQFGGVTSLAKESQLKAAGETCQTGGASTAGGASGGISGAAAAGFAIIGGCLLAVLALIGGVIFLIVWLARGRKPKPAPVYPQHPGYPAAPAPYQSPYSPPLAAPTPPPPTVQARICPNGHPVAEAEAAFCPMCGASMGER